MLELALFFQFEGIKGEEKSVLEEGSSYGEVTTWKKSKKKKRETTTRKRRKKEAEVWTKEDDWGGKEQ